jgi:hypothetical protein
MLKNNPILFVCILNIFIGFNSQCVLGQDMLVWESSAENISGFKIYYGESINNFTNNLDVGNVNQYPLNKLNLKEKTTSYLAVTGYNDQVESSFSNPVSWQVPDKTPPCPPQSFKIE